MSYELYLENQRRKAEGQTQKVPPVDSILDLVVTAMSLGQEFLRQSAFTRCKNQSRTYFPRFAILVHS